MNQPPLCSPFLRGSQPRFPRALQRSIVALLAVSTAVLPDAAAVDGTWSQVGTGTQLWESPANWVGGIVADGVDGNAIFNVELTNDQNISVGATGRTIGSLFLRDITTSSAGGFGIGIAGDGPITLSTTSGRSVISVATLGSSKKLATGSPLINSGGVLKIGPGQLSIRADNPQMTGDFVAAGGLTDTRSSLANITGLQVTNGATFQLDFASNGGTNVTNLVNTAIPLVLGGNVTIPPVAIPPTLPLAFNTPAGGAGTFTFTGKAASTNAQTFNGLTINAGAHTVNVTAGTAATLTLGAITRPTQGTVNIALTGASTVLTTTANTAGPILAPWAIVSANTWAVSAADAVNAGAITGLPAASYTADTWSAGTHTDVVSGVPAASGATTTVRFNTAAANTVTLGGAASVSSGGILVSSTVAAFASQISGGSLTSGTNELVVHQGNNNAAGAMTIDSTIVDNGSAVGLTKSGAGVLNVTGTNSYTGPTTVNAGNLFVGTGGATGSLGSGPVRVMPGATLTLNRSDAALVMNNSIVVDGVVSKTGPGTVTLAGNISGNGAPSISTGTLILSGTNTYGAVTNIGAAGILAVGSDSALGTNNVRLNTAGATLTAAGSATRTISNLIDVAVSPTNFGVPGSGDLIFSGTFATGNGAKVMNINNTTTTVTGIVTGGPSANLVTKAGTGTLVLANPGNTFVRPITINAGTLQIASEGNLGVAPAAATANHLAFTGGTLRTTSNMSIDDATRGITLGTGGGTFEVDASTTLSVVNKITGAAGDLRKTGAGILSLEGANDYTGTTTVSAGTLLVQGSLSGSNVAVNGGTLGGAGSITTGATGLTLNAGARLTPGAPATAGTLAVNAAGSILDLTAAVTPTASGALLFDLDTPALSDKVLLSSGSLTIGTGVLGFDDFAFNTFAGIAQNNVYVLFDGVAPINGQLASNVTGSIGAFTGQLQLADGGNDLVLVVVPEPSAAALLMIGTVGFFGKRRRQPRLAV